MILGLTDTGKGADRQKLVLPMKRRMQTHTHVIGGSRSGKSKLLEWMIRQDIRQGHGLCLIDWHGPIYENLVPWLKDEDFQQEVILVNPATGGFVTGFDPFAPEPDSDLTVQVNRRIELALKPNELRDEGFKPRFVRIARLLFAAAIDLDLPLHLAYRLLLHKEAMLRKWAIQHMTDPVVRDGWEELQQLGVGKSFDKWMAQVESTQNRLIPFIHSRSVKRFIGLKETAFRVADAIAQKKIVLVNLKSSPQLDRQAAGIFAALLLNQFFEAAMRRAGEPDQDDMFFLYLDEFGDYVTPDLAEMLDQVLKGGLHLVLAHHRFEQMDANLKDAVLTNGRIRLVFGGSHKQTATELAENMFIHGVNQLREKVRLYRTITKHAERTKTTTTRTKGWIEGVDTVYSTPLKEAGADPTRMQEGTRRANSESVSESETDVLMPYYEQELASIQYYSQEEKNNIFAESLMHQGQRKAYVQVLDSYPIPMQVPTVSKCDWDPDWELELFRRQNAYPTAVVDAKIADAEREFQKNATPTKPAPQNDSPRRSTSTKRTTRSLP